MDESFSRTHHEELISRDKENLMQLKREVEEID
jgi:hypothetical protein